MLNPFELEDTWLSDWQGDWRPRLVSGEEWARAARNRPHDTGGEPKPSFSSLVPQSTRGWILSSPQQKRNPTASRRASPPPPPDAAGRPKRSVPSPRCASTGDRSGAQRGARVHPRLRLDGHTAGRDRPFGAKPSLDSVIGGRVTLQPRGTQGSESHWIGGFGEMRSALTAVAIVAPTLTTRRGRLGAVVAPSRSQSGSSPVLNFTSICAVAAGYADYGLCGGLRPSTFSGDRRQAIASRDSAAARHLRPRVRLLGLTPATECNKLPGDSRRRPFRRHLGRERVGPSRMRPGPVTFSMVTTSPAGLFGFDLNRVAGDIPRSQRHWWSGQKLVKNTDTTLSPAV